MATDIHLDQSSLLRKRWSPLRWFPGGEGKAFAESASWWVAFLTGDVALLSLWKSIMNLLRPRMFNNLGLGTPHSKIHERVSPNHRKKDRAKMDSIMTTSPGRKQRKTPERQRKIPGSGATSIRVFGITLLTAAQRSHWWLKWKPLNQMWVLNLSQNQKGEDRSLTQNSVPSLLPPSSSLVN